MAENTIQRVIEVDATGSIKTVRDLQNQAKELQEQLQSLQGTTAEYNAVSQRAAKAQEELAAAFEIAKPDAKDLMATIEQLAQAEARDAEQLDKLVDALVEYRDAGYDVSASLGGVSQQTEQAVRTTRELDVEVNTLRESGAQLIDTLVREQQELSEVQAQRKALNKEIAKGLITEDQAREVKGELLAQESIYKARVSESRQTLATMTKEVAAAEGSYNQMSQTLGRLRKEFRNLSAEQRNSPMGEELVGRIQSLDTELKNLDASIGNYQRNVGNYGQAVDRLIPGFSQLTEAVKGLSNGTLTFSGVAEGAISALKGMTTQALAFIATPVGATIAALVVAYQALKSSVDDLNDAIEGNVSLQQMQSIEQAKASAWQAASQAANEESARSWIKIKGAISEAWQAYKIFFKDALKGDWVHLWRTISGLPEMRAAGVEAAKLQKQLHELQVGDPDKGRLGTIEKIGKAEREIALLREKAADRVNYSDGERQEFLQGAIQKNKEVYALKRQELDLELKIAEAQHKASPDSAEFQKQWANLRKMADDLDAQEANAQRALVKGISTISQTAAAEAKRAAGEQVKAQKQAADETTRIQRATLKLQQDARAETEENEIKIARENYEQNLADFNKTVKEKGISEDVAAAYRTALAEKTEADIAEIRHKYLMKAWEDEEKSAQRQEEIAKKIREAEKKQAKERQESVKKELQQGMGDLDRNARLETAEAKRDIDDPQKLEQELQDIQQRLYEAKVALIDEMLKDETLDTNTITMLSNQRADLQIKNIERVADADRKAAEEKRKRDKLTQETALNVATSTLNSLSSILGEETAAGKAAAVAAATIDTYKAANSAYASLASVPIVGPGLGAAAAAAAIIAGIANVKKILSTNTDGSNSAPSAASIATPAVVTPPAVVEQVPLTRTLTSASEEERLNQMASPQRVYVVYDDIEQAGRNVDVQQTESTF